MIGRPKKIRSPQYDNLGELVRAHIEVLKPKERLTITEAAERYRYIKNPGSYNGPYKVAKAPYVKKIQDVLSSRDYTACVFVAPAQSAKTDVFLNWYLHSVICDPGDMILYQTSRTMARDFSIRRVDRMHRHSPEVGNRVAAGGDMDNTFDKIFRTGMMLTLSWPTINELSGRPVGRVGITDYDRMPLDVDGEGSVFDLGRKRTTTFGRSAMTYVESSPGYSVSDESWIPDPKHPHEAPPTPGILSLFNRGDRQLYYWECRHCRQWFEPRFSLMRYELSEDIIEAAETAWLECPRCRGKTHHNQKYELNQEGIWLPEGMRIERGGKVVGEPRKNDIASFWLKGPAAAFQEWPVLVTNYLKALQEFEKTQEQSALKTTINTDQGEPYRERHTGETRNPEDLASMAEDYGSDEPCVPTEVRFLTATIDVQKNSFEVQVQGVTAPYKTGVRSDHIVIDRFSVSRSKRVDEHGDHYRVRPNAYSEDWDELTKHVIKKTYPLADDPTARMSIRRCACDSGGMKGVTSMAYSYWLRLRKLGLGAKMLLIKGTGSPQAPRINLTYPDSSRKDRKAIARGEVPVLLIQTDKIKDDLNGMFDREEHGGMIRFSSLLPDHFYRELTVEYRNLRGKWENPKKLRQESWDLLVYHLALCEYDKIEQMDWDSPPKWAAEQDKNLLVTHEKASNIKSNDGYADMSSEKLGELLG